MLRTLFSTDIVDGEVKTADLGSNAVTAAKIKDGEVKAAEIAMDDVGAAELQGVTKLLFTHCVQASTEANTVVPDGAFFAIRCDISGADSDDDFIITIDGSSNCFVASSAYDPSLFSVNAKGLVTC